MRETSLVCLLDKEAPPEHSFVDGMLAKVLGREPDLHVYLVVSRPPGAGIEWERVRRHHDAVCLPVLARRRGMGRITNFVRGALVVRALIRRERSKGRQVVLFVRNEPTYLLIAAAFKHRCDRLIFQSSFPHEETHPRPLMRWGAKLLYRIARSPVDAVLAVSPTGLERVERLFPAASLGRYIPLMADVPGEAGRRSVTPAQTTGPEPLRFIYIGDHARSRQFEVVFAALAAAVERGFEGRVEFVGADPGELTHIRSLAHVPELESVGVLSFRAKVPRSEVWDLLHSADVGLSLLPRSAMNRERSPTKLTEYMGAGLAVLATRGVPLQESFIEESGGGLLVEWSENAIRDGFLALSKDPSKVRAMKRRAAEYAARELRYESCRGIFRELMGAQLSRPAHT